MRPSASVTSSAVIFRDSMRSRASGGELAPADEHGVPGHALGGGAVEQRVAVALHLAAQVAVGDDAQQAAVGLGHRGQAEALARHLEEHVLHRRARAPRAGSRSPVCIRSSTRRSFRPELAARVQHGEVVHREAAPLQRGPCPGRRPWPGRRWWRRWGRGRAGQASSRIETSRWTSAAWARVERGLPVRATSGDGQALDLGHAGPGAPRSRRCS